MTEEQMPTFVPGDEIVYVVQFNYPANVQSVAATFRNDTMGEEVVLRGGARLERSARRGTRKHLARLHYDGDPSKSLNPGTYRFARLEAVTYGGKSLDFDNPPEDAFVVQDEPDETTLPRLDRVQGPASGVTRATWFEFPEGHPDKRRQQ